MILIHFVLLDCSISSFFSYSTCDYSQTCLESTSTLNLDCWLQWALEHPTISHHEIFINQGYKPVKLCMALISTLVPSVELVEILKLRSTSQRFIPKPIMIDIFSHQTNPTKYHASFRISSFTKHRSPLFQTSQTTLRQRRPVTKANAMQWHNEVVSTGSSQHNFQPLNIRLVCCYVGQVTLRRGWWCLGHPVQV